MTDVWMTAREAEQRWGFADSTVRQSCARGKLKKYVEKGLARKSAGTWIISEKAMREVYGEPKEKF